MKKLFFFIAFFLFTGTAMASPFVVSDPYPESAVQPDGFLVSVDGGSVVESPAVLAAPGSYKMRFDIGNLPEGEHTMTVRAFKNYAEPWGRKESVPANFTFPVPAGPQAAGGFKLVK